MIDFGNWHLLRGLYVLSLICLFMLFVFLEGAVRDWRARRRARRATRTGQPLSAETGVAANNPVRAARRQPTRRQERAIADSERRAA